MFRALLFAALVLFAVLAVPAESQIRRCGDDRGVDRCDPEQQRKVLELYGVLPIETHHAAGDQVRRAFYVDGYGRDIIAIAFIRARGREPIVSVHLPRRNSQSPEPLIASVPDDVWSDVLIRSRFFDRSLVPLPNTDTDALTICLHPWSYTVEATDPSISGDSQQGVRRQTDDTCGDDLAGTYARELARSALPLFSYCGSLDSSRYANTAVLFEMCGKLHGDRNAAAAFMNRVEAFDRAGRLENLIELRFLLASDAVIDWDGERSAAGSAEQFWLDRLSESNAFLVIDSVEAESTRRARVEGVVWRFRPPDSPDPDGPLIDEAARLEMIWVADCCNLVLQRVSVGPLVADRER